MCFVEQVRMLTDTLEEDNDSLMELASEVRQLFRDTLRLNAKYKHVTINELSLVCFFLPTPEYTHFGYSNRINVVLCLEYIDQYLCHAGKK